MPQRIGIVIETIPNAKHPREEPDKTQPERSAPHLAHSVHKVNARRLVRIIVSWDREK